MTAYDVLAHCDMVLGEARKSTVLAIWRAANDEGTIQAGDMVRLFPGRPEKHTTTSMRHALIAAGCDFRGLSEWRARGNRSA